MFQKSGAFLVFSETAPAQSTLLPVKTKRETPSLRVYPAEREFMFYSLLKK
jgi:hypothetical protein